MSRRPTVDRDRTALYAAELAAFDGTDLERVRPFAEIEALTASVVGDAWWTAPPPTIRRARADAGSSSTRCVAAGDGSGETDVVIRLAEPQCTIATAAHELAHALAGVRRGHDAVFRRAFLDVVASITNVDTIDRRGTIHVDQLAEAFRKAGLDVAERQWNDPGRSGPIAL